MTNKIGSLNTLLFAALQYAEAISMLMTKQRNGFCECMEEVIV
ncbi:hypothetical protein [Prevotella sp. kh1p2]|nr:hypothetical protein [Prevotella sp. kh1p2]